MTNVYRTNSSTIKMNGKFAWAFFGKKYESQIYPEKITFTSIEKLKIMEILKNSPIGQFVAEDYRTAAVFQKYGIDFCCKGGRTIEEVCTQKNIPAQELLNELKLARNVPGNSSMNFQKWPLDLLADYIEKKHHRYILQNSPAIIQFLDKLCKVHGGRHPELYEINQEFNESAQELKAHMKKEEMILFPYVRKLVSLKVNPDEHNHPGFGNVQNPIRMMMQEHEVEGERFRKMSLLSNGYTAPEDGCTTYRVCYYMLKDFENDLHLHIHLENNILFPKAIELENESHALHIQH